MFQIIISISNECRINHGFSEHFSSKKILYEDNLNLREIRPY